MGKKSFKCASEVYNDFKAEVISTDVLMINIIEKKKRFEVRTLQYSWYQRTQYKWLDGWSGNVNNFPKRPLWHTSDSIYGINLNL